MFNSYIIVYQYVGEESGWWFGNVWNIWLIFLEILGISSSQLTKSYFSEGWLSRPQPLRPFLLSAVLKQRSCAIACQSAALGMRHRFSTCRAARLTPCLLQPLSYGGPKRICRLLFSSHQRALTGATACMTCLDWPEKQPAFTYAPWL